MVQVQGYICYTLFNILCIITLNIIIINFHKTELAHMPCTPFPDLGKTNCYYYYYYYVCNEVQLHA